MINVKTMQTLLEFKEGDIKKLTTDQLRLLLGVLRYSTRIVQRELNEREPVIKANS